MSPDPDVVRRAATVTGRVQGVSFRWYTERRAVETRAGERNFRTVR
jgi:Acylphosphatase